MYQTFCADTVPNCVLNYSRRVQKLPIHWLSLSGRGHGKLPVFQVAAAATFHIATADTCVDLVLPDLPFSQERQEIHIFMDIS